MKKLVLLTSVFSVKYKIRLWMRNEAGETGEKGESIKY